MKVGNDGKLRLHRGERRIGNFVYKNEAEHIKITDINSNLSHRISKTLNVGRMLEIAFKERHEQYLGNYAAMVWLFSNIVTDEQFFLDIDKACMACVGRHKEFYGIKEDITPAEDAEILEEARETYEAIEELREK